MLGVMIAEDDVTIRNDLVEAVTKSGDFEFLCVTDSGNELLEALDKELAELIILDIGLPDISGIEVARKIRNEKAECDIIFVTSHMEFTREAIEFYALDYLVKPIELERLYNTLEKIKKKYYNKGVFLEFIHKDKKLLINVNDILFIEARARKSILYTTKDESLISHSFKEMNELLPKEIFFKTARSFIVNITKVKELSKKSRDSYSVSFHGTDKKALLSKKFSEEFDDAYKGYFGR